MAISNNGIVYTDAMRRAFRSLDHLAPKGFALDIIEHQEGFLTVRASEKSFMLLSHDDKIRAANYMIKTKKALEQNGAIVQLVREGGKEL
jgi:hypothetical protein